MLPLFPLQFSHLCQEMNHQQTESFWLFCLVCAVVDHLLICKIAEVREYCLVEHCMVPIADNLPFAQTYCDLSDRYDWKKGTTYELFKYTLNFCCRIVWSTRSKVFLKSKNTAPTISERSTADSQLSHIADRAVWHEWFDLNPNWRVWNRLCFSIKVDRWRWTRLSSGFDKTDSKKIGLKVLGSVLSVFLGGGLLWLFWIF